MWSSIQVLPNQVSNKSFYTFEIEDIDLREKLFSKIFIKSGKMYHVELDSGTFKSSK